MTSLAFPLAANRCLRIEPALLWRGVLFVAAQQLATPREIARLREIPDSKAAAQLDYDLSAFACRAGRAALCLPRGTIFTPANDLERDDIWVQETGGSARPAAARREIHALNRLLIYIIDSFRCRTPCPSSSSLLSSLPLRWSRARHHARFHHYSGARDNGQEVQPPATDNLLKAS